MTLSKLPRALCIDEITVGQPSVLIFGRHDEIEVRRNGWQSRERNIAELVAAAFYQPD